MDEEENGVDGIDDAAWLGIRSLVLESAPSLRVTGFALATWTNAWRALDALGLGDALRQQHKLIDGVVLASTITERTNAEVPFSGNGHEARCVQRKLLLEAMENELPEGTISKAAFTGRSAVRSVAIFPQGHEFVSKFLLFVGKGFRAGCIACDDKTLYWFFIDKEVETVIVGNYVQMESEGKVRDVKSRVSNFLWHGGSVYDAWFSCASNQVAQVLLTLPYSFSQLGMLSGIMFQLFYGLLGSWTAYLISVLYVEYRTRKEREKKADFRNHVIQRFEVLDGLLGKHWRNVGLAFNCTFLLFGSVIQLIACAR
ncbi:unnamed protein product [Linum tenue]|uniref:Amino acid transporter transmembrane domain-containing protein n=1 Tax=Linum tenue TaxID=586396 RepID=A0AAV0QU16_9ROSI|nr:unnamed protein product [Linum tenue]